MKAKTSLLVLGLFTIAGAVTVSCGGSSDGDDNTNTAGTSSTAGSGNKAGSSSSAAGTNSNTGGSGNNTSGTGNNGGTNNGSGGAIDFPSFGGAGLEVPGCAAGTMTGSTCTQGEDQACQLNDTTYCACQGTTWTCINTGDLGAGGAGPVLPQSTCPAGAQTGDACSNGPGLCAGQACFCGPDNQVTCLG